MKNLSLKSRGTMKESTGFLENQSGGSNLDELLTISEVAALLKISPTGVRRLQQSRQIPFIKVGGSIRFLKSDIFAYLQKMRVESISE